MKFYDVNIWIDDHVTVRVMAEDGDLETIEPIVEAALRERFNGVSISHGILDIDDALFDEEG